MAKVSLRAYNREIEAMIDRGNLDEAVAHCQHILKTFPKHIETYRLLGKAYLEARRYDEAVDIFSRVLSAEPNDFVAHVGMSIIHDEQNRVDDAIWHMERAFEVQSANPAIQAELQRLYGRREGVQPPRIRMTRGALAHMYMRGELYPQAISETKGVLEEDQGRSDMQVLLAKAYFKSGQKKDAADAASVVLRRYPFCYDANLVLAEILGADRPESAQVYRQRVIELDPYAGQVVEDMFRAGEVSDAAVSIERLEWTGQPAGLSANWASSRAIQLEGGEGIAPSAADQPADEEIPDFLRAAGWGPSTGAFDESKASAGDEEASAPEAEPIAEGDLPDWVKAMAPRDAQPVDEPDAEMPDWINKIGTEDLPVPSAEESAFDELTVLSDTGAQPDWMKDFDQEDSATALPADEQPDWLKGIEGKEETAPAEESDQPEWMKDFEQDMEPSSLPAEEQADWKRDPEKELEASPLAAEEQSEWLKDFDQDSQAGPQLSEDQSDQPQGIAADKDSASEQGFIRESELPDELSSETKDAPAKDSSLDTGSLGTSEQEQDDSFAWLEGLAAKRGATEGLLTKPEDRREDEPDWIKQAKSLTKPDTTASSEPPVVEQPAPAVPPSKADTGSLGTSEQEQDDSFAWLEGLAAKQGATEGLLTRPEDRREEEPEWVKGAKIAETQKLEPAPDQADEQLQVSGEETAPKSQPESAASASDTEPTVLAEERDEDADQETPASTITSDEDTVSWLKSLDEPEEQPLSVESELDELPDWMQDISEADVSQSEPAGPMDETSPSEQEGPATPAVPSTGELPGWLRSLEDEEATPSIPASDDLPDWMHDETGETIDEPTKKIEPTHTTDWKPADEVVKKPEEAPQPAPQPVSEAVSEPVPEPKTAAPEPKKEKPKSQASQAEARKEPSGRKAEETPEAVDPTLDSARTELSRSNIPGALDFYSKLIKKGRFLEEVTFDLREALYRYPVEVSIWQALGDAYMRANQLQNALDAYTKAEELLR